RIIQEQLNNVIRHAEATRVSVSLISSQDRLLLLVADNGKGCDPAEGVKGVGIINMKTRASLHGASVVILSQPGEGFQLHVIFPLGGVMPA
ncbi:MAG: hypothetical protein H7Y31_01930, partial [Chitinophagaceae bacterium]|nr:hypothetical protein [Chitinophagaceae bacterium]